MGTYSEDDSVNHSPVLVLVFSKGVALELVAEPGVAHHAEDGDAEPEPDVEDGHESTEEPTELEACHSATECHVDLA